MIETGKRLKCCHQCRSDYRRANKAREWDEKFSERAIAETVFCPSCLTDRMWWWFVFLPVDAGEVARYLARGKRKREIKTLRGQTALATEDSSLQLED